MFTTMWIGLALLAGGAGPGLQSPTEGVAAAESPAARSSEDWRRSLAGGDLDARLDVFDELVATARRQPGLKALVEAWAREDGELGWTARLALRELEQAAVGPTPDREPGLRHAPRDPFGDDAFEHFFDPFAFGHPLGGSPTADLLRDMEERLGAMLATPGFGGGLGGSSQSFRMESGPNGVRVEVEEQDGNGTDRRTYEAGSLEELYEQHPELRGRLNAAPLEPGLHTGFRDLYERLRERRGVLPLRAGDVPTDRLGILMRAPGGWSAEIPGLEPGVGLYVERVYPGTLAAELGLRPGDVLTHLDGRALSSADDVKRALAERQAGDRLTATLVDPNGKGRELVHLPAADLRQL